MNLIEKNHWVWNSRWTHWWLKKTEPGREDESCMESTFSGALDETEIKQGIATLKKAKINTVLVEGLRNLIRFEQENKTDAVIETIRKATLACHREKIRILHHTTTSFASQWLKDIPKNRRNWMNIDALTGDWAFVKWKADWTGNGWYLWCINNQEFRTEYFRLIKKIVQNTKIDGLMTDEVYFRTGWHNCVCPYCLEKFKKRTGHIIPNRLDKKFWGRYENPIFRAWIRFRAESVGDFYKDLYQTISKVHPHPILLGCKNDAENPSHVPLFGCSNEERMRGVNLLFGELCNGKTSILYSWRKLSVSYMAYNGLSNHYGTPTMAIMYASSDEAFVSWAIRSAHGIRTWATSGSGALQRKEQLLHSHRDVTAFSKWFQWEEKNKKHLSQMIQPLANVAVLFSASTRDMDLSHSDPLGEKWYSYVHELGGWCQTLTDGFIQYAMIQESDLILSKLKTYRLVILPNTTCLSTEACHQILQYVREGGNLLFTHQTANHDETGRQIPSKKHRFHKLGIDLDLKEQENTPTLRSDVKFGTYGKGSWVYFSNRPGVVVFSDSNSLNSIRTRNHLKKFDITESNISRQKSLMLHVLQHFILNEQTLTVIQAPQGTLIKAYHKDKNKINIHLVNLSGDHIKFGEKIPRNFSVSYPQQNDYIKFKLKIPFIKNIKLISPDTPALKKIPFEKINNNYFFTLKPNSLHRYAVVCIHPS